MRSDIITKVKEVGELHPEIIAAYLYGSYAKCIETEESDIDVALLLSDQFIQSALYPFKIAGELEKKLKRKVDVRILNGTSPSFLNQVFKYGKVVYSRDEKRRVSFEFQALRAYLDIKPIHLEYNRIRRMRLHA
ncbi:MAG: nucleotidyltransferase domain-containing protein [Candidatus Methanoperedens sp.]|nr:nucleotidyltransferase domain-containing protein [Candidatus Methanoperedens sp.]